MSKQVGATTLDDLDELYVDNDILDEIHDIIEADETESNTEDVKIEKPVKKSGSMFTNKLKKNGFDVLVLLVLLLALGNKYSMHYLFKLPFLVKLENSSWGPIIILSILICLFYFSIKMFV